MSEVRAERKMVTIFTKWLTDHSIRCSMLAPIHSHHTRWLGRWVQVECEQRSSLNSPSKCKEEKRRLDASYLLPEPPRTCHSTMKTRRITCALFSIQVWWMLISAPFRLLGEALALPPLLVNSTFLTTIEDRRCIVLCRTCRGNAIPACSEMMRRLSWRWKRKSTRKLQGFGG